MAARETDDGCVLPQQDLSQEEGNGSDVLVASDSGAECVHGYCRLRALFCCDRMVSSCCSLVRQC